MLPEELNKRFEALKEAAILEEKMMTVKDLASVLNVDKSTILKTVKRLEAGGEVVHHLSNDEYNNQMFLFDEQQAIIIKQEIQKHHNLNSRQIDSVSSEYEENLVIAEAINILNNRNNELKKRLKNAEDSLQMFTKSEDLLLIRDAAKIMDIPGIGGNKLFNILRELNILGQDNLPYQKYINSGYFKVVEYHYEDNNGKVHISKTPKVTQSGIVYLKTKVSNFVKMIKGDILTPTDALYYEGLV